MILHLKCSNVISINQQSDLLMHSSGQKKRGGGEAGGGQGAIPAANCITHQNGRDAPRDFNTIKYTKNRLFSAALHPLLRNGAFFFLLVSAN